MCVLAHVFEEAGLATVSLVSVIQVAEKMRPPRALYGEFPLGRPLGKPGDAEFQHDVLRRAFALLDKPQGPVLETHPEVIELDDAVPLECALPPRFDPSLPEAVDEARALRSAYDRTVTSAGRTMVGRVTDAGGVPDVVAAFVKIADGVGWMEAGLPGDPVSCAHDVRAYYEEAAVALVDGPPDPGGAEAWYYEVTAAGKVVLEARRAMQAAEAPFPFWFYMARATRQ